MTSIIEVWSASASLFASMWCPLVSVITTLYYVVNIFHRGVWYHTLSLLYACIRKFGQHPQPIVPNFVSFVASTAELTNGEKLCTQSLSASLIDAPGKRLHFRISAWEWQQLQREISQCKLWTNMYRQIGTKNKEHGLLWLHCCNGIL